MNMIGRRLLLPMTAVGRRMGMQASFKQLSFSARQPIHQSYLSFAVKGNRRFYSVISEECKAKSYDYKGIKELVQYPKDDVIIVDVREPVEYQQGHIPGAINIPFKSNPGALGLNDEEFEENFGFPKPDPKKELVFYCLAGIRSTAAEDLAKTFGYKNRGNYVGSWEDWVSNEVKTQPPSSSSSSTA